MGGNIDQSVSPGIGGFIAFFLLALALWLLMRNMSGHLRKVRFDEEAEDERRAAEAGADVITRPRRRQIFLPVRDDDTPRHAEGPARGDARQASAPRAETDPAPSTAADVPSDGPRGTEHEASVQGSASPTGDIREARASNTVERGQRHRA